MTLKRTAISWRDPVAAFAPLRDEPFALLMHGARRGWSYICANPVEVIAVDAAVDDEALSRIKATTTDLAFKRPDGAPPFCGGWAGLVSYEYGRALSPKLEEGPPRGAWPDLALGLYQEFIAFDHRHHRAEYWNWRWRPADPDQPSLAEMLLRDTPADWTRALCETPPTPRVAREDYEQRIARAVAYVHAGDCFQANISQRFDFKLALGAHPFDLTRRLDETSAAPYSAYLRLPGLAMASNSPERFLKLRRTEDGALKVSTKPIKGTRPRGATPEEDARLAAELEASEKDRAENLMIVDLMRNDLSRVSKPGSVKVPKLNALESFANVHHLVSTVEAELAEGMGPVDLIRAAFPGGSVTGAPKIRAMQIIAELEDEARGPYCGSLIWITPDDWMDSSILIRSTALEEAPGGDWTGQYRSGGGIVADSTPSSEYVETLDKASAMTRALTEASDRTPRDILFIGAARGEGAVIDPRDRSFLLGDGCFETLRVVDGQIDGVDEHLALLRRSMDVLGLVGGPDDAAFAEAMQELAAGHMGEAALRITVSRGAGGRGAEAGAAPLTSVLSLNPLAAGRPYPALHVSTSTIRRNETSPTSRIKTTSYADNLAARREAMAAGVDEALMLNMAGRPACLAMGNLFLVTPTGVWVTPPEEEGVRPGYGRARLINALREKGEALEIRAIALDELRAEGVSLFGANSLWGVRPVSTLDGRSLKARAPIAI